MKTENNILFYLLLTISLLASGCARTGFFEQKLPELIGQAEADLAQAEAESHKQSYKFPELKIAEDNLRDAKELENRRTEAKIRWIFAEEEITANDVSLLAVASIVNSQIVLAKANQSQQAKENTQLELNLTNTQGEMNRQLGEVNRAQQELGVAIRSDFEKQLKAECRIRETQCARAEEFMRVREEKRGVIVSLAGILFDKNKFALNPGSARKLDTLANVLKNYPDRKILVEGHTDGIGADDYNQALSEKRADAVKSYLIDNGLSPDMVEAKGYGKKLPVAANDTSSGRQQNRRVDLVILNPTEEKVPLTSASAK